MSHLVRRAAVLIAAPTLALGALVAVSGAATAATDPAPSAAAGDWLAGQVPADGLIVGDYGPDFGLSIDVALALGRVDASSEVVTRIRDAVAADVDSYIAYSYADDDGTHTGQTGGATAKTLVLDRATGGDGTDFGGVDLVDRLESLISPEGRVISTFDGAPDSSYSNTYVQSLAVTGLAGTGSSAADAATSYLLDQQCAAEGYFRGDIPEGVSEPCADEPDTDSTAQAVLALADEASAAEAREAAVAWLLDTQLEDGSFGGGPSTEAPNTNSTGLAAAALAASGEHEAAAEAASWVRAHQLVNVANCVYYATADLGAIAYDDASLDAARDGLADGLVYQTRKATADALPALLLAPAADGQARGLFTAEYIRAGSKTSVGVMGAAPGEAVCAMLGEQSVLGYADAGGELDLELLIPAGTRTSEVALANAAGTFDTVEINALGKAKLKVTANKQAKKGKQVKVTVKGLAPAESVTVSLRGKKKAGQANAKGVFTAKVKVTGKPGKAKVKAVGQFKNRKGTSSITVRK